MSDADSTGGVIEVGRLRKVYGETVAVDDVSFDVRQGEIFGIVGPNGAGKTTAIECVMGLRRPDSGSVSVLGMDPWFDANQVKRRIGVQLQQAALPNRIKVGEALDLFASFYDDPADTSALLQQWGLEGRKDAAFANLSGGQKQRLFIALALVNHPELVFFDELTTGLDPQARRATWELVRDIRASGTTVVLVTHFMEEAEHLCDRVAIIDHGRIVALDSPAGLVEAMESEKRIRFTLPEPADLGWLANVEGVHRVAHENGSIAVHGSGPLLVRVATALGEHGLEPVDLSMERTTLEDVFLATTGRELRA